MYLPQLPSLLDVTILKQVYTSDSQPYNFALQRTFGNILVGWLETFWLDGCHWYLTGRGQDAAEHPTMPRIAHHKEFSSPKCQEYPD